MIEIEVSVCTENDSCAESELTRLRASWSCRDESLKTIRERVKGLVVSLEIEV